MPLCPYRLGLLGLIACLGTGHYNCTIMHEIQICANENNHRETNAKLPEPPLAQKSLYFLQVYLVPRISKGMLSKVIERLPDHRK